MEKVIENIEYRDKIAKITLHKVYDRCGIAAEIFSALGQHGLNVEAISTTSLGHKRADISLAILETDVNAVIDLLESIKEKFGTKKITIDQDRAIVIIFGTKLSSTPGIAGRIFGKFAELGINIEMVSASLSVLSVVIKKEKLAEAIKTIKQELISNAHLTSDNSSS